MNGHVGKQRIGLENHADIALVGLQAVLLLAADGDATGGRRFEAGDHAQDGRLAAAGGAEEGNEFTLLDLHVEVMHDLHVAEGFLEVCEFEKGHENQIPYDLAGAALWKRETSCSRPMLSQVIEKAMTASADGS